MRITLEPDGESKKMKEAFQKETMPFKSLTLQKKIEYIWDYYKWFFIFGICFITIAAVAIPAIINNHREAALYAVFVNTEIAAQEETTLMDDYVAAKEIDMENKRLVLDTSLKISRTMPDQLSMESSQKILVLFASKSMDVVVEDEENMRFYAEQGCYVDLREYLSSEQQTRYASLFITANGSEEQGQGVYAIDISESPVLQEEKAFRMPVYFSITVFSEHTENALAFLDFLMGY